VRCQPSSSLSVQGLELEALATDIVFGRVLVQQQADPYPGRICRLAAWTCPYKAVYIVDRLLSGWDGALEEA
jgi:hypothetical protein